MDVMGALVGVYLLQVHQVAGRAKLVADAVAADYKQVARGYHSSLSKRTRIYTDVVL